MLDVQEHAFNVFHILQAEGSRHIPTQEEFVHTYGVRSVVGFGAPLPNGDLFTVILFSREVITDATAQLFKPLALCAQIALSPFVHAASLPVAATPPLMTDTDEPPIGRLQGRIAQLEKLLSIHEQTVKVESSRLETIINAADMGTWEWDIATGHMTFNERWAATLGYRLEDFEPHVRTWEDLLHPMTSPP